MVEAKFVARHNVHMAVAAISAAACLVSVSAFNGASMFNQAPSLRGSSFTTTAHRVPALKAGRAFTTTIPGKQRNRGRMSCNVCVGLMRTPISSRKLDM
eukprot:3753627-Rhodomonas_salina.2